MARFNLDDFSGKDVSRLYIAAKLREAQRVEEVLNKAGIDYTVKVEPFQKLTLLLFTAEYQGAAFYVLSGQLDFCKDLLAREGLSQGLIGDSD